MSSPMEDCSKTRRCMFGLLAIETPELSARVMSAP